MGYNYNSAAGKATVFKRATSAEIIERDLCERYSITPNYARLIAELQGYGERDV